MSNLELALVAVAVPVLLVALLAYVTRDPYRDSEIRWDGDEVDCSHEDPTLDGLGCCVECGRPYFGSDL